MTQEVVNSFTFSNLVSNFQFRDFLDIFFIAIMIYTFIALFIRTHSIRILFGVVFLVIFYGLVVFLNLPLSKMFLNTFFGMFLVILAVVFQRELRKFFEFLGILGMRKKFIPTMKDELSIIAETIEEFSRSKTGCLLVFPGLEPIERHIEKGFLLNGRISKPILLSIFDKNSPGHDGALVVEGDRIRSFGVHLPLAEELVSNHGTRHRAALGISQRTDALALIVSEETGKISLAHNGKLFAVEGTKELEEKMKNFFAERAPRKEKGKYGRLARKNVIPITVSFGLALVSWVIFNSQSTVVQKNFLVPIEIRNLPETMNLNNLEEPEVVVTLSGLERNFKILDEESLKASIDVSDTKPGWHKILIKKDSIKKPSDLTVVNIEPASIKFSLEEKKIVE